MVRIKRYGHHKGDTFIKEIIINKSNANQS